MSRLHEFWQDIRPTVGTVALAAVLVAAAFALVMGAAKDDALRRDQMARIELALKACNLPRRDP